VTTPSSFSTPSPAPVSAAHGTAGRGESGARVRTFVVPVVVLILAGVVSGLVWPLLVPNVELRMTEVGPYPASEHDAGLLAAMDAWYAVLGGVAGVLLGAVLGTLYLRHGLITVLALLVGGVAAALASFVVGGLVANGAVVLRWEPDLPLGASVQAPLTLRAYGFLLVWPIATLAPLLPLAWLGWADDVPGGLSTDASDHRRDAGPMR
jgi:hypothetical protein